MLISKTNNKKTFRRIITMKKAYISPRLDKVVLEVDVVLASALAVDLGGGDWGVQDEL